MNKEYYWNLLKQVNTLEKEQFAHNIPTQTETTNLKSLAFCGLIRLGETFQIESNAAEIEKLKQEKQKKIINSDSIIIPELMETIRIKHMDNTVYSLSLSLLKDTMKSDYAKFVEGISNHHTENAYDEIDIEMPDIFSDIEDDFVPEASQEIEETSENTYVANADGKRNADYEPRLNGDINYNRDPEYSKSLDTFCVNHVRLVYQEGGKKAVVDFNIYPLTFKENEPATDIFVTAISGNIVRAGVSRGTSTAVRLDFDELSFMARASWKDGKLRTQVNCLNKELAEHFVQDTVEYMPASRTYATYMQEDFGKIEYSFFPALIGRNGTSGNVPSAMAYQKDGHLQVLLSNEKDAFSIFDDDGLPVELSLYWSGGKTPQLKLQVDEE